MRTEIEIPVPPEAKPLRSARAAKPRPNRIFELTKERKWTYAEVARRVREIAKAKGDTAHELVHEVTINRLALGKTKLNQEWMQLLGEVYGVPATEIISVPVAQNLRRVRVVCALEAHEWRADHVLPDREQFDIMIPSDQLQGANLYAGEIIGPSYNLRYPDKSIVVIAALEQTPGEIEVGKRYHVRRMRVDGMIEDSIKTLHLDDDNKYWLKPESNHPAHQEWVPLAGDEQYRVEIVGRVRGVFFRED